MTKIPIIDSTWFVVDKGVPTVQGVPSEERLRCASLLKPLYSWSAIKLNPFEKAPESWANLAQKAITVSSNTATTEMWEKCGADNIIGNLMTMTGMLWAYSPGYYGWGSVAINALDVAKAYCALLQAKDPEAAQILSWMTEVDNKQTFGIKSMPQKALKLDSSSIASKAGWYVDEKELRLRTHLVFICKLSDQQYVGLVMLTAKAVKKEFMNNYLAQYKHGEEVIGIHQSLMAATLKTEALRLLKAYRLYI